MAGRIVENKSAAISAATTTGYVTVASTTGFYARATAYISKTGLATREVEITGIISSTQLGVRFARTLGEGPNYGQDDVNGYSGGDAVINMPKQFIYTRNTSP